MSRQSRPRGPASTKRDDVYGVFKASYTWYEYFDPSTGYILGYNYVEQDNGQDQGQSRKLYYTDNLYVTSTSYPLTSASAPTGATTSSTSQGATTGAFPWYLGYVVAAVVVVLLIAAIAVYAVTRRRGNNLFLSTRPLRRRPLPAPLRRLSSPTSTWARSRPSRS